MNPDTRWILAIVGLTALFVGAIIAQGVYNQKNIDKIELLEDELQQTNLIRAELNECNINRDKCMVEWRKSLDLTKSCIQVNEDYNKYINTYC